MFDQLFDHDVRRLINPCCVLQEEDPLEVPIQLSSKWKPVTVPGLPKVFTGGWVGFCGYDTVRYVYAGAPFTYHNLHAVPACMLQLFTGCVHGSCLHKLCFHLPIISPLVPCAGKLPFSSAPPDDRSLPEMHLGLYENVIVFDQATKLAYVVCWVQTDKYPTLELAYLAGVEKLTFCKTLL